MDIQVLVIVSLSVIALVLTFVVVVTVRRGRRDPVSSVMEATGRLEEQLRRLSELFLVPRSRGVVGEAILSQLLASWLPHKSYELQYTFRTGTRVDAVIRLGSRLVPIDSKFPMEAASRFFESHPTTDTPLPADLRKGFLKHVDDIAGRYILPDENTMAFALMYIPSERVYYSIFVERPDELLQAALQRNVVPVSPGTLFVYLQTVAYGLRGLALPENVAALADELAALRGDLEAFRKTFDIAQTHLRNLSRVFDDAGNKLGRVEVRADRLGKQDQR